MTSHPALSLLVLTISICFVCFVALSIFFGNVSYTKIPERLLLSASLLPPRFLNDGSGRENLIVSSIFDRMERMRSARCSQRSAAAAMNDDFSQLCGSDWRSATEALGNSAKQRLSQPVFSYTTFGQHWLRFDDNTRFDGVLTVPSEVASALRSGYLTRVYICYSNGFAFSPAKIGGDTIFPVSTPLNIVSFPGASRDKFESLLRDDENVLPVQQYLEISDQYRHSIFFALGIVDAIYADELIVSFYHDRVIKNIRSRSEARRISESEYAAIARLQSYQFESANIPPTPYVAVFQDATLRDLFDHALFEILTEADGHSEYKTVMSKFFDTIQPRDQDTGAYQEKTRVKIRYNEPDPVAGQWSTVCSG